MDHCCNLWRYDQGQTNGTTENTFWEWCIYWFLGYMTWFVKKQYDLKKNPIRFNFHHFLFFSNQKGSWLPCFFLWVILGGGFKYVSSFTPIWVKIPFLTFICFNWVGEKPPTIGYYVLFYQGGFPPPQCFHMANLFPHRFPKRVPPQASDRRNRCHRPVGRDDGVFYPPSWVRPSSSYVLLTKVFRKNKGEQKSKELTEYLSPL